MKTFLQYVAEDLMAKHGSNLSGLTLVFPSKRASLFLNEYLARLAGRPLWSPAYTTISDLFRRCSPRTVGDQLKLVCELHRSFTAQTGYDETLDHFFSWGQLLLSDFDDIDKHLVPADRVLRNLRDLHELDGVDYLSEAQVEVIRRFFSTFSGEQQSQLRDRFLRLWSRLHDIYTDFNQRLSIQRLAYEGALYREVVETLSDGTEALPQLGSREFVFVGFNQLLPVEETLFKVLKKEGRARFYWDFDRYYAGPGAHNEAGEALRQCLALFPNELDVSDGDIYDNFSRTGKSLTIVSAPTENIQARYVTQWARNQTEEAQPATPDTAIVLCNEGLLQAVVHCLPPGVGKVNVTTGYPLAQTPVASLITHLIALRTQGYSPSSDTYRLRQVNAVLRHPYTAMLSPEATALQCRLTEEHIYHPTPSILMGDEGLRLLFSPFSGALPVVQQLIDWLCDVVEAIAKGMATASATDDLMGESLFRAHTLLNRLRGLSEDGDLPVDVITLQRLIQQIVQITTVPFEGEPLEGLQVMGMLETRCLDFRRLLILSCNEGSMPRGAGDTSFIPFSLRKAYGLTMPDHKVALQSYYFHRLLQRADDITIVYNNATTDGQKAEMSRFLLQLMVESPHKIELRTLRAGQRHIPFQPPTIEKDEAVMEKLLQRFRRQPGDAIERPLLTPTAINRYQRCPLQFYYNYVCDLREPDETEDDVIDNRVFGNIFHEAAHIVYSRLTEHGETISARDIDRLLRSKVEIEQAVDQAIEMELFRSGEDASGGPVRVRSHRLSGLQLINREVIIEYVRRLLKLDRRSAPLTILGLECDVVSPMKVGYKDGGEGFATTIGGRIDRLDRVTDNDGRERIRVVDFKTGASQPDPLPAIEAVFEQNMLDRHSDYYLQTFLYACLVKARHKEERVSPALLFIQHAGADDYDPTLCFGKNAILDVADDSRVFGEKLRTLVDEIFSRDIPFKPTEYRTRCQYCAYYSLCRMRLKIED